MEQTQQMAFNLLFNAAVSFAVGYLAAVAAIAVFRLKSLRIQQVLFSLPVLKVCIDLIKGIPDSSVITSGINLLELPPLHRTLNMSFGLNHFGPSFNLLFWTKDLQGYIYSASIADFVWAFVEKTAGINLMAVFLISVALVSAYRFGKRARATFTFESVRQEQRQHDMLIETRRLGLRQVDIYVSDAYVGSPFSGGLFSPYVCIPQDSFAAFTQAELAAVLEHELAHIRSWDLVTELAIRLGGEIFWFIPFYSRWVGRVDQVRELIADQSAVKAGAQGPLLASALLKIKECEYFAYESCYHSAFLQTGSSLKIRVASLLEGSGRLSARRRAAAVGLVALIVTVMVLLSSTVGGNHRMPGEESRASAGSQVIMERAVRALLLVDIKSVDPV
jgi:beta-lactamase regulating signal transducer with metallopeptidase domain